MWAIDENTPARRANPKSHIYDGEMALKIEDGAAKEEIEARLEKLKVSLEPLISLSERLASNAEQCERLKAQISEADYLIGALTIPDALIK